MRIEFPAEWFLARMFPEKEKCQVSLRARRVVMLSRWPVIGEELEFGVMMHHSRRLELEKKLKMFVPNPWSIKHWLNRLGEEIKGDFIKISGIDGGLTRYEVDRDKIVKENSLVGEPVEVTLVVVRPVAEGRLPSGTRMVERKGAHAFYSESESPLRGLIYQTTIPLRAKEFAATYSLAEGGKIEAKILRVTVEEFLSSTKYRPPLRETKTYMILEEAILTRDKPVVVEERIISLGTKALPQKEET